MIKFRNQLDEMAYEIYGVDYFFDVDKYYKKHDDPEKDDPMDLTSGGAIYANFAWLTCPAIDLIAGDMSHLEVMRTLSKGGHYRFSTDVMLPDIREHREEIAEFMRRGPVGFVNSMKSWPTSRTLLTYKHFGEAWFDTMMGRALIAAEFLGDESNPVKEPKPKPKPSKVEGNVITVNFGKKKAA